MRQVFRDSELQRHFVKSGYNHVPMLSPEQVAHILAEMSKMRPNDNFAPDGNNQFKITYHCSFLDDNAAYKRQVHNLIQEMFTPYAEKCLAGYRIVNANFYVKPPHMGDFKVHQNWPILEDLNDTSVTIWCPLQDTYRENGTIQFVEGSHKILPYVEGPTIPSYFDKFKPALFEKWLKPIPVKAGEALIFDDGLIHWTARNDSDTPRIAIQILCVPRDATPIYFYQDAQTPDRFEVVEADVDFFIEQGFTDLTKRQSHWKSLGFVENHNRMLTEEEFAELMARGDEIRSSVYASGS